MIKRIDLHTHSTCSDGTLEPKELARLAKKSGISAIALTDHDSSQGTKDFCSECKKLGIEGIAGVEISTKYKRELHIVGLYAHGMKYDEMIAKLKNSRCVRNKKMIKKLCDYGFEIKEEDLTSQTDTATIESVGRLHMANALVSKGYVIDKNKAFEKYIAKGAACYVEKFSLTPEESVRFIKECGGVAIWAHPAYAADTEDELYETAKCLKETGLDGMECLYSRYTTKQADMCERVADKLDILRSGGSDFHGANKPDVVLGRVKGKTDYVPYEILEELKKCVLI